MENFGEFLVNHWVLWTVFFILVAVVVVTLLSSQLTSANTVNTAQAVQLVNQQKGLFIDIRGAAEFAKGHIVDSVNLPASNLLENLSSIKDTKRPVILVSSNGQGTIPVVKQLQDNGFSDIYLLKGGLLTWKEAKLPLFS